MPDGSIEIQLTQGKVAYVGAEDAGLADVKWQARRDEVRWYASRHVGNSRSPLIGMHVAVAAAAGIAAAGMEVDHIDGDGLNNRRSNLRKASRLQNAKNRRINANNKSGHKGVSWMIQCQRWRADISADGRKIYLGLYSTSAAAADAYQEAAQRLHGEFARRA